MSSSRSDVVTHSIRVLVCSCVTKEFCVVKRPFLCNYNSMCRVKKVPKVFQGSLRMFQGSFKDVSTKFPGCFKEVSRVFQESFKNVSRKFQGRFKKVSRTFDVHL